MGNMTAYLEDVNGTLIAWASPKGLKDNYSLRQYLTVPNDKNEALANLRLRFFEVVLVMFGL